MTEVELRELDDLAATERDLAEDVRDVQAVVYWETILEAVGELLVLRASSRPCPWITVIS
jgi:hypothetical protein